jgi:hypothetical protein
LSNVFACLCWKVASSGKQASKAKATTFGGWLKSMEGRRVAKVSETLRFLSLMRSLLIMVGKRLIQGVRRSYRKVSVAEICRGWFLIFNIFAAG